MNIMSSHCTVVCTLMASHDGIKANTKAEKLAHNTPISSTQVIPIPSSDALPTLQNYIHTKWQATWGSFPNNKLQKISPKLHYFPPLHQSCSRKEQIIPNRLNWSHPLISFLRT